MSPTDRVLPITVGKTPLITNDSATSNNTPQIATPSSPDGAGVAGNDPITEIRLIASLPANLGQSVDMQA